MGFLKVLVLYALTLLALLGIWTPVLEYSKYRRIQKIVNVSGACLLGVLFVGFWIVQWPQWHTSALLTSLIVLMFVVYFVLELLTKRKRKPVSRVD
jgi:F0F1-type ATP synthase assembly protein I